MDISDIQKFHSYKPLLDEDPINELEKILKKAKYLKKKEKDRVRKAYTVARDAHAWVERLSGEPYIIHPVRVLEFLMMIKPDAASMQAALLHDVIEDTDITKEEIELEFWEEVAELCEWLVKVSKVRFSGEERQLETLKKTFLAMGKDLRVIFIKLADRIHNIQTLHYHPKKEKANRIANETLKVFVPIAKRLGLYVYQWYLENGAFKNRDPKEYKRIYDYVVKKYGDVDKYKNSGIDRLKYLSEEADIPYLDVKGRLKSPYRIHKKLQKYKTKDISKVMDILAFRVLTKDLEDCYNMLGLIHKHYTPIFAKMKDYIALPKPNWYRSLHTTILGMYEFPVEIQVRTEEMEQVAEYGVAAHFAYAEAGNATSVSDKQADWIQRLQGIVQKFQDVEDKEWFKQHLNVEILEKNIFVYTPKGDIIELPQNSTVLDFAFRVHTDIWLKFKSAFINGRIVPIDYTIKTGDIVDIKTFKNKITASRSWEKYLHTPTAKTKLTRHVRQAEKESVMQQVLDSISERLHAFNLPTLWSKEDLLRPSFSDEDRERTLRQVYDKQITPTKLLKMAYKDEIWARELEEKEQVKIKKSLKSVKDKLPNTKWAVIIDIDKELDTIMCQECKPSKRKKVKIIAKSDKQIMKIHCVGCVALKTVKSDKLYEAHWRWDSAASYILRFDMKVRDEQGNMIRLLEIFAQYGLSLNNIHTNPSAEEWRSVVKFDVKVNNISRVDYLIKELNAKKWMVKELEKEII